MKMIVPILFFLASTDPCLAQKTDRKLQEKVEALFRGFHGVAGVYIEDLRSGRTVSLYADTVFPTASMVKIPILIAIMDRIRKGELAYHQELVYKDSLLYAGVDILGSFKSDEHVELSKLMMLMLTTSDNTASLWLQSLAGGGTRINAIMDSLGFEHTRVNSRTPGREGDRERFGWGQTTPREMATLMKKIYRRDVFSREASDQMLRLLGRNYWDEESISQVPPEVFVACKNGAVDDSRSETLLVMAPHGPYIFSVITKEQSDKTWNADNEGWVLARKLSRLLWEYHEPGYGWSSGIDVDGRKKTTDGMEKNEFP
jgi:beta-lactamase class A